MGDTLKKVQSGQKLKISASAYNAFVDAALDYQRTQRDAVSETRPLARQADLVLVRNDSGTDVGRFGVLAIRDSVFAPTDAEFKNRVVFAGVTPTVSPHGRFVVTGLKDASEYQEADPANRLVLVEWDKVGDPPEHDERLRLHIDDTAVAEAIEGNAPDANIATASGTLSSSAIQQCTLGVATISVYTLNGHAWNAFGNFGIGDEVVVWELPSLVGGCDYVGTPLDFFRDTFHEFKCIGRAYSGLVTTDLTVEFNISTSDEYSYVSGVRTYDNAVWSTKYPDIAVGTPVVVARVNAAGEYVGFPILGDGTGSLVVRVKATGNPPPSSTRPAQRVDTADTIDVNIMGGNWSAAFPVVKTDDYFWAVRVATDPDVWYGFPSFDFRIGVGAV